MDKKYFTTHHISEICGVTMPTVINWIKQGKLPAYKTLGGHRRVEKSALIQFLKSNRLPLPDDLAKEWSCRILLVDDEKAFITLLTKIIRNKYRHCVVGSAMNGFEAGRQVLSFKPDLIVLDLKLPGIDGFEVCKNIKSTPQTKNMKIIAVTGYHTEGIKNKILSCGADAYLPKPFDAEELMGKIAKLLN